MGQRMSLPGQDGYYQYLGRVEAASQGSEPPNVDELREVFRQARADGYNPRKVYEDVQRSRLPEWAPLPPWEQVAPEKAVPAP